MYTNYAYGVQNQTGTSSANYNLFVTGTNDYTGSTGFMIKNDTTLSGPNKKGTRIFQDNTDNAYLDFRTTATDGAKSFAFRLQDDASPSTFNNMLTLNKDTVSDTSVYGASVSGRVKASQFFVNQPDIRAPVSTGVYLGQNNNTTGYFNINKGTGSGGFNFQTFNADGVTNKTNLSLNGSGSVQIPYYSTVTTDSQDSETTAMVVFDATGNLVRSYQQNQRFRSVETRLNTLEGEVVASVPIKVNEIITRLNTLKIWNTKIANLSVSAPPAPFNPSPVTTTAAVQVQLALSVSLATAQDLTWQTSFINAVATNLGISPSRIVISSVSLTATVYSATYKHLTLQKAYTAAAAGSVFVNVVVNPDPAGASTITPTVAASIIIAKAQDPSSDLAAAVATTGAAVDTGYVPAQKPSATVTPAPTQPPFNPLSIPGMLVWLDANDLTTFSPANITNNADITEWRDKSGNQNHCAPTIFSTSPVMNNPKYNETGQSGKKSVYLNRSKFIGNFTTAYQGQSLIVFMVMKATHMGPDSVGRLMSLGTLGQTDYQDISATQISGSVNGYGSLRTTPSWTPMRNAHFESPSCLNVSTLVELIDNPTEHTLQINGGTTSVSDASGGLPNAFNLFNYTIGGDLIAQDIFVSGYLSEVLVFGSTLTTVQKQKVEGYLANKWGLQSSLASNHPYKSSLPASETIMTGQKIRFFTNNSSTEIASGGIEVYSYPGGPNIINSGLNVTTLASYNSSFGPSNWIDNSQTAWIAYPSAGQYIEVDLGSTVPIYKIVLYSRIDCCGERSNGARIQIKDSANSQLYLSNPIADLTGSTTVPGTIGSTFDKTFPSYTFYPSNPNWVGNRPITIVWKSSNYKFLFDMTSTISSVNMNTDTTINPDGHPVVSYNLPAGTYWYSATVINSSNDGLTVWLVNSRKRIGANPASPTDAGVILSTVATGISPWTPAPVGPFYGSFTLTQQTLIQPIYSNGYYAYSSQVKLLLVCNNSM